MEENKTVEHVDNVDGHIVKVKRTINPLGLAFAIATGTAACAYVIAVAAAIVATVA